MTIIWPLLIALLGLLMWALCSSPIPKKAGEHLFVIGVFWFTYLVTGKTFKWPG